MLKLEPFTTIITGGALGVELEAEKLVRDHGLAVEVLIPPCHPRSKIFRPLTTVQLDEAISIRVQVTARLNQVNKRYKHLQSPISLQYIHRNYRVVKQAEMVLAFTIFQHFSTMGFGETGWAVEVGKLLCKIRHVYDVEKRFGSGTSKMKKNTTPVIKCPKDNFLCRRFYQELLLSA